MFTLSYVLQTKFLYHAFSVTVIKLKRRNAVSHLQIPNRTTLNGEWQNHRRLQAGNIINTTVIPELLSCRPASSALLLMPGLLSCSPASSALLLMPGLLSCSPASSALLLIEVSTVEVVVVVWTADVRRRPAASVLNAQRTGAAREYTCSSRAGPCRTANPEWETIWWKALNTVQNNN